jgi:hypothetical protein
VRHLPLLLAALLLTGCYDDPFATQSEPDPDDPVFGDDDDAAPDDDDVAAGDDDDSVPDPDDDDTAAPDDDDASDDDDLADDDDVAPEPIADDAEIVSSGLPATLACGESFAASITVLNTGTATWLGMEPNSYKLGAVDDLDPFVGPDPRVWLGESSSVPPGGTWTFTLPLFAPSSAGTYTSDWQMVHEGIAWFGESVSETIEVSCTAPVWSPVACVRNGAEICDDESFTVSAGVTYGVLCEDPNNGIGYIATNTGPTQPDGVNRCQGWEDQGLDAWDFLDYVGSLVCDTAGEVLELDLSPWVGGGLWFGAHDNPGGGGNATNICLVQLQ